MSPVSNRNFANLTYLYRANIHDLNKFAKYFIGFIYCAGNEKNKITDYIRIVLEREGRDVAKYPGSEGDY